MIRPLFTVEVPERRENGYKKSTHINECFMLIPYDVNSL